MLALHREDLKIAAQDLGGICRVLAYIMLVPLFVTAIVIVNAPNPSILYILQKLGGFVLPALVFYSMYLLFNKIKTEAQARTKHMMITVSLAWLIVALIGALPFVINNTLSPLDSFFESISGWTTTGMTMIPFPEEIDHDVIFYRALSQWVGGVGIIVLALVVFLRKGTLAMDYYASEVGEQRIKPRLKSTVTETWKIYTVYTLACIILLDIAGMNVFDAVAHAFAALSTGGFSSHAEGVGYYNDMPNGPIIQTILIVFMLIGAISFLLHFKLFDGEYKKVKENLELKYLTLLVITSTAVCFLAFYTKDPTNPSKTFLDSFFQMVSAITCTGFATVDLTTWPDLQQTLMMILMYVGGLYGSTAGGIKILRLIVILQAMLHSIKKLLLPKSAVLRMKMGGKQIKGNELIYALALSSAYLLISVLGAGVLMATGYSAVESFSLSLSAMGNVGLVNISGEAWFNMIALDKITLCTLMWIGRLEIFPVFVLLSSILYKRKRKRQ